MKKKFIVSSGFILSLSPVVALAAANTGNACVAGTSGIEGVLCKIRDLLGAVLPVLIALGVVYFVWGVVSYMIGSDEEAKKKGTSSVFTFKSVPKTK